LKPPRGRSRVGRWFAELAGLEEASVAAFEILSKELVFHGAPARLIAAARSAAHDEVRHARAMGDLARRFGGKPWRPRVRKGSVRPIEQVAIENATEGCVRETFGALIGMWQARFAGDPNVRRAMASIARDEGRHAALSWQIAAWIEPRLDAKVRAELEAAKVRAVDQLKEDLAVDPPPSIVRIAGMPTAPAARRLLEHADAALWTPS
jgi:hypothetical protein